MDIINSFDFEEKNKFLSEMHYYSIYAITHDKKLKQRITCMHDVIDYYNLNNNANSENAIWQNEEWIQIVKSIFPVILKHFNKYLHHDKKKKVGNKDS